MTKSLDPRLDATRSQALSTALRLLEEKGMMAVTHGAISGATGISRSTLYRHWPDISQMRNDAFKLAATPPRIDPPTDGPLRADLTWMLGILMSALNETPWGQIAPQVIAAAATDNEARVVINEFMEERMASVKAIFTAAEARGELAPGVPLDHLVQMAIAVPYFRKLIAGLPLDQEWLETHVGVICDLAEGSMHS